MVPPGELERYVGSYSGPGLEHEVLAREDTLFYHPSESIAVPLHPLSPHVFIGHDVCFDLLLRITFEPSEDGTVDRYRAELANGWSGAFERRP